MLRKFADGGVQVVVDLLDRAESRLIKLTKTVTSEDLVFELANLLRDIGAVRMHLEIPGVHDARNALRVHEKAMIYVGAADGSRAEAVLQDISSGGALIACDAILENGQKCTIDAPGLAQPVKAVVLDARPGFARIIFEDMTCDDKIALAKHLDRHFQRY